MKMSELVSRFALCCALLLPAPYGAQQDLSSSDFTKIATFVLVELDGDS